ncbi:MAG TPA: hypothetical protein VFA09_24460 [Ktedonobacteraceae bacterium]|nr:hypothetical protein [Ktedonobacteraceae bacterium]
MASNSNANVPVSETQEDSSTEQTQAIPTSLSKEARRILRFGKNDRHPDANLNEAKNPARTHPALEVDDRPTQVILPEAKNPAGTHPALEDDEQPATQPLSREVQRIAETPLPPPQPVIVHNKAPVDNAFITKIHKQNSAAAQIFQNRYRQLCISLFFNEHAPVRSVGFTSSIDGEGKSLISLLMAQVLARDSLEPVTLLECNWENPTLHKYFHLPEAPGLAEFVRGSCTAEDVCYQVENNLTVIPAGDGSQDAMKLLHHIQRVGLHNIFSDKNRLLVVDLPAMLTAGYSYLAACLPESIIIVAHSQIISESMLKETYARIKDLPVRGVILNHMESHVPHWIRQIL